MTILVLLGPLLAWSAEPNLFEGAALDFSSDGSTSFMNSGSLILSTKIKNLPTTIEMRILHRAHGQELLPKDRYLTQEEVLALLENPEFLSQTRFVDLITSPQNFHSKPAVMSSVEGLYDLLTRRYGPGLYWFYIDGQGVLFDVINKPGSFVELEVSEPYVIENQNIPGLAEAIATVPEWRFSTKTDLLNSGLWPDLHSSVDAVLRFENFGCSAFFTSSQGHVLTNIHCLQRSLQESGAAELVRWGEGQFGGYGFRGITRELPVPLKAHKRFDGKLMNFPKLGTPSILAIGEIGIVVHPQAFPGDTLDPDYLEAEKVSGDWVLLKYELPKGETTPCLRISSVEEGDTLYAMGYPKDTLALPFKDPQYRNKDRELFVSEGKAWSNVDWATPYFHHRIQQFRELGLNTENKGFVVSSAMGSNGMSGGPLVSPEGSWVALHFQALILNRSHGGSLVMRAITSDIVQKGVEDQIGSVAAKAAFDCR